MSGSQSDDAEKRKQKLKVLRAKRVDQGTGSPAVTGGDDSDSGQGEKRGRLMKALAKRRQAGGATGSDDSATTSKRGLTGMGQGNDENAPRKKGAMKKKMMLKKMAMKKRAMKKKSVKNRAGGRGAGETKIDASSTLKEISQHRSFLEERISKLTSALNDRTAELKEVVALEAEKSKEK